MANTRMPRSILRGCKRRADNLEKSGIIITLLIAPGVALLAFLYCISAQLMNVFRKKEWWHNLPL